LFGYNYLLSKVKEAVSDMHIFIDEFVTKMAEHYGGRPQERGNGHRERREEELAMEMIA
jgi:hypothetical protein